MADQDQDQDQRVIVSTGPDGVERETVVPKEATPAEVNTILQQSDWIHTPLPATTINRLGLKAGATRQDLATLSGKGAALGLMPEERAWFSSPYAMPLPTWAQGQWVNKGIAGDVWQPAPGAGSVSTRPDTNMFGFNHAQIAQTVGDWARRNMPNLGGPGMGVPLAVGATDMLANAAELFSSPEAFALGPGETVATRVRDRYNQALAIREWLQQHARDVPEDLRTLWKYPTTTAMNDATLKLRLQAAQTANQNAATARALAARRATFQGSQIGPEEPIGPPLQQALEDIKAGRTAELKGGLEGVTDLPVSGATRAEKAPTLQTYYGPGGSIRVMDPYGNSWPLGGIGPGRINLLQSPGSLFNILKGAAQDITAGRLAGIPEGAEPISVWNPESSQVGGQVPPLQRGLSKLHDTPLLPRTVQGPGGQLRIVDQYGNSYPGNAMVATQADPLGITHIRESDIPWRVDQATQQALEVQQGQERMRAAADEMARRIQAGVPPGQARDQVYQEMFVNYEQQVRDKMAAEAAAKAAADAAKAAAKKAKGGGS